jgi:hypothetical protein
VETHDSGEYRVGRGKLQRNRERNTVRGLNGNHNKDVKSLFKSAAISASTCPGPLQDFYVALVGKGIRPTMARLTLARKIAAITLTMWKKGVGFDPKLLALDRCADPQHFVEHAHFVVVNYRKCCAHGAILRDDSDWASQVGLRSNASLELDPLVSWRAVVAS